MILHDNSSQEAMAANLWMLYSPAMIIGSPLRENNLIKKAEKTPITKYKKN